MTTTNLYATTRLAVALAALLSIPLASASAAMINIRSLESLLATPDHMKGNMYGLWSGDATQKYEYNMPFIELRNGAGEPAITAFEMTIGHADYVFSKIFDHKSKTNSWDIPANGQYALLGKSTPGVGFTTSAPNAGRTLRIEFAEPLGPDEVVRFQVDIDRAAGKTSVTRYAPYTGVFFQANGGSNTANNSVVTLEYAGNVRSGSEAFPNFVIDPHSLHGAIGVRAYNIMQTPPTFPDGGDDGFGVFPGIPEPSSAAMALVGIAAACRRRGR